MLKYVPPSPPDARRAAPFEETKTGFGICVTIHVQRFHLSIIVCDSALFAFLKIETVPCEKYGIHGSQFLAGQGCVARAPLCSLWGMNHDHDVECC